MTRKLKPIPELEKLLLKDVNKFYLLTDKAHGIEHIRAVMTGVSIICFKLRRMDCLRPALVAAAYHDIFSTKVLREVHHIHSFSYVLDHCVRLMKRYQLTDEELTNAAYACLEHRSSWTGGYNSIISEIVAAADRGIPRLDELEGMVRRSYLYARSHGKTVKGAKLHAVSHIAEKFGQNKSGAVPEWYHTLFEEGLQRRQAELCALDETFFTEAMVAAWEEELQHDEE